MTYIPFISQDDLILDNQQKRLVGGKIEVLDPISNNPVDIFVYDGSNDNYIVATNPIYLDVNSRPEHTYFSTQLVLCRLYKYIGNFSDPMIDDDTNNWEFVREWNGSFHENDQKNDTIVYGFSSIQNANPDLGSITVVGYWNNFDCEARTYVWDANCVQTPDNGYIVKANGIDTGRWILKFDGEWLPSTYYGVYPGRTANINALLSYVSTVGTAQVPTAPGVYLQKGVYNNLTSNLTTSKKVLLDADTQFPKLNFLFTVQDVNVIGNATHYICDFKFAPYQYTGSNTVAHSSWFRTIDAFIGCDAQNLIWDRTDFFTNKQITGNQTLYKQKLTFYKSWDYTYAANAYININDCEIEGQNIFRFNNDFINFYNETIKLEWFVKPSSPLDDASYDFGAVPTHHIGLSFKEITGTNIVSLDNFEATEYGSQVYKRIMEDYNQTSIDFQNRPVPGFNNTKFSEIHNALMTDASYGYITNTLQTIRLYNVKAHPKATYKPATVYNYYIDNDQTIYPAQYGFYEGCDVRFVNYTSSMSLRPLQKLGVVHIVDSTVEFTNDIDTFETQLVAEGSTIKGEINFVSTGYYNYDKGKKTELFNVCLDTTPATANNYFCNEFVAKSCDINVPLKHYPYLENGKHHFYTEYVQNRFWNNAKIIYTQNEGSYNNTANAISDAIANIFFDSNQFNQTDPYGIYMPYWTVNGYNSSNKRLIAPPSVEPTTKCYYHGNTGNCPSEWNTDAIMNDSGVCVMPNGPGTEYESQIVANPQTRSWCLWTGVSVQSSAKFNKSNGVCGSYATQYPAHKINEISRGHMYLKNAYTSAGGYGVSSNMTYRDDACYPDPTYGDMFDNRMVLDNDAGDGYYADGQYYRFAAGPNETMYKPTPYMKR